MTENHKAAPNTLCSRNQPAMILMVFQ